MEENPKCPNCGGDETFPIIYGLPLKHGAKRKEGEVLLGGCIVYGNDPEWYKGCKNRF